MENLVVQIFYLIALNKTKREYLISTIILFGKWI